MNIFLALALIMVSGYAAAESETRTKAETTAPASNAAAPHLNWRKRPTADEMSAVFPAQAEGKGISGQAVLSCRVDIDGALDECKVTSEVPAGMGFGASALAIAPVFLMTAGVPDVDGKRPIVVIPMNFKAGQPRAIPDTNLFIANPLWLAAPSFADIAAAYPATADGAGGYIAFHCRVSGDGALHACDVTQEQPPGKGFAKSANTLVKKFRVELGTGFPHGVSGAWTDLNIRMPNPATGDFTARHIGVPNWLVSLDSSKAQRLFPPEAAAKGVKTGRGIADCIVGVDGSLLSCHPAAGDPPDLGFSEAAVRVVEAMRMSPRTTASGPVDGAEVQIPIRFNLAVSPKPSSPKAAADP